MQRAGAMGSALRCLQVQWATIPRDASCDSSKACIQSLHLRITLRVLVRIKKHREINTVNVALSDLK